MKIKYNGQYWYITDNINGYYDCKKGSKCIPVKSEKKVWYGWANMYKGNIVINAYNQLVIMDKHCHTVGMEEVRKVRVEVVK